MPTWQQRTVGFIGSAVAEFIPWVGVIAVGIQFILVSDNTETIMRSTVSIVFILNIDEIVFQACSSPTLKDGVKNTAFQVQHKQDKILGVTVERLQHVRVYYSSYWYLPYLTMLSVGMVSAYRVREECSQAPNGFFGQSRNMTDLLTSMYPGNV